MTKKIGVGLIGLGGVGSWGHLPGYLEIPDKVAISALCDKDEKLVKQRSAVSGGKAYTDYRQLIADDSVDIVDICLPHYLHGKVALEAIDKGKHVLVEKPFTTTLEEASEVISKAREKKVKLMVAENTRFVVAYEIAKQLLDQRVIGDVTLIRTYIGGSEMRRLSNPDNWIGKKALAGGGPLFDAGVHSFYLYKWMMGDIESVHVVKSTFLKGLPVDVEDNVVGLMKLSGGAIGNFALTNTTESPWTERLEMYGTKGSIIVDMLSERPLQVYSVNDDTHGVHWKVPEVEQFTGERPYPTISWQEPFFGHSALGWKAASMRREVKHFVDCVLTDGKPRVSPEDAMYAVRIALKAYESADLGREVRI